MSKIDLVALEDREMAYVPREHKLGDIVRAHHQEFIVVDMTDTNRWIVQPLFFTGPCSLEVVDLDDPSEVVATMEKVESTRSETRVGKLIRRIVDCSYISLYERLFPEGAALEEEGECQICGEELIFPEEKYEQECSKCQLELAQTGGYGAWE
jgi:uncharacterized paraquat-inducible protein A